MIITFCGHSSFVAQQNSQEKMLLLFEKIIKNEKVEFYLGGYGNFDNFAYKCAKAYQKSHSNVKVTFITPYLDEKYSKLEYAKKAYDEIIFPDIEKVPKRYAIPKRNEWMIKNSDFVIAYVGLSFGGAYNSFSYAKRIKKPYINVYNEL